MSFSGKTAEQLLEQAQNAEDRDRRVQALNSTAQILFDEAYSTGDDARAVNFVEEVFGPEIQGFYSGKETDPDLEYWREELSGLERESGIFHVPATESAPYDYLRSCMDAIEEDYDQIVGVHSGGLAPVYAVEDLFGGEPVVLRYSHRDREDEDVQITPEMENRADFEGSDVLVLDDVVESGETLREVGQYIMDRGADSVDALPVRTSIWDMSHDSEMLDLVNGGVKYGIIDYEKERSTAMKGFHLWDRFFRIYGSDFSMQVFAFGHSITQGFWDRESGWVMRLRKFLDKKSLENPDEYYFEVYNLGVSGNDSRQLLERFNQEIEARLWKEDETIILIQIGANDIQYLEEKDEIRVEKEEYRENLEALLEEARSYTDRVVLMGEAYTSIEGPIPWSEDKHLSDERLGKYVETQRKIAKERNIPYIDLRDLKDKEKWLDMLEDGSHPNSKGHELIYENVKEKLMKKGLLGL